MWAPSARAPAGGFSRVRQGPSQRLCPAAWPSSSAPQSRVRGRAGLGGDESAGTLGGGAKWPAHGSEGPLEDLDKNAAWPVTHMGTGEGEPPRPSVSSSISQAESLT